MWSHLISVRECHRGWFEGAERLSGVKDMKNRHGVWFVKCGTPSCVVLTTWGTSGTGHRWGLHPLSRAVSCAALKHCCFDSHANTWKAGAGVKHLVPFLFSCDGIMWPVIIISPFLFYMCHKKLLVAERIFFGGLAIWSQKTSIKTRRNFIAPYNTKVAQM